MQAIVQAVRALQLGRIDRAFVQGFEYDWRRHKVPPKQIERASPLQFMILDAVDQAFAQAGYVSRRTTAVVRASSWAQCSGVTLPVSCRWDYGSLG